jgi:hypothetical protein
VPSLHLILQDNLRRSLLVLLCDLLNFLVFQKKGVVRFGPGSVRRPQRTVRRNGDTFGLAKFRQLQLGQIGMTLDLERSFSKHFAIFGANALGWSPE